MNNFIKPNIISSHRLVSHRKMIFYVKSNEKFNRIMSCATCVQVTCYDQSNIIMSLKLIGRNKPILLTFSPPCHLNLISKKKAYSHHNKKVLINQKYQNILRKRQKESMWIQIPRILLQATSSRIQSTNFSISYKFKNSNTQTFEYNNKPKIP